MKMRLECEKLTFQILDSGAFQTSDLSDFGQRITTFQRHNTTTINHYHPTYLIGLIDVLAHPGFLIQFDQNSELTKGLPVVTDSLAFASVVRTNYQRPYQVSGTDGHGPHPSCGPDVTSPVPVARSFPTPAAAKAAPVPATAQPATSGDELSRCRRFSCVVYGASQRTGCRTGGIFQPQLSTKR